MKAAGLHDLRVAMVKADPDSIYEAYLALQQAAAREPSKGCAQLLSTLAALFARSYEEKAA